MSKAETQKRTAQGEYCELCAKEGRGQSPRNELCVHEAECPSCSKGVDGGLGEFPCTDIFHASRLKDAGRAVAECKPTTAPGPTSATTMRHVAECWTCDQDKPLFHAITQTQADACRKAGHDVHDAE